MIAATRGTRQPSARHAASEVPARVPSASTPGRSIVTRRALVDIVRTATLGSYGVTGFAGGPVARLLERLGIAQPGIRVGFGGDVDDGSIASEEEVPTRPRALERVTVDLDITVAFGVPIAEVARQVDSAVRYAVRRALDREIDRFTIHVDGLRYHAGDLPTQPAADPSAVRSDDLAASGTDVA